jgi:hypothetical protein
LAKIGNIPWNKDTGNINAEDNIKRTIRHRLRRFVAGAPSHQEFSELVGLSRQEFKDYIESKFQLGMNWSNYGSYDYVNKTWNYDHIIPLCKFNLNEVEELKKACHYTNIQPLWAIDNLNKSSK